MGPRVLAGRYRLSRQLGRGGMGVVWLADDELIGRQVAIKELRAPAHLPPEDRELVARRALAEGRNAARVRHPNAVTLHDVIPATAEDDAVYLIMELVRAPNLAQIVVAQGPLSEGRVTSIALQLLDVLDAAHALGVVHRDVKPSNIIIEPGDTVKLADFGIAHAETDTRLTQAGIIGTQAYMAPELYRGADIHPAADLWSAGATLYFAVEGVGPFDRDTTVSTLNAVLMEEIPRPTCRSPLADAISALLVRDPAWRSTGRQVRDLLQRPGQGAGNTATWSGYPGTDYQPADARDSLWHATGTAPMPQTLREEQSNVVMARVVSGSAPGQAWQQFNEPQDAPPTTLDPTPGPGPKPRRKFRRPSIMASTMMLIAAIFGVSLWWSTAQAGAGSSGAGSSGVTGGAASASASLAYGDQVAFSQLALGQCLNNVYSTDAQGDGTPTLADCGQQHDAEVIAVIPLANQDDASNGDADNACSADVGKLFPSGTISSSYDYRVGVPSTSAWDDGYHRAVCMIVGANEARISDRFTPETSSS
jgi:serine/threonine protein kinase